VTAASRLDAREAARMAVERVRSGARFCWLYADARGEAVRLTYVTDGDDGLEAFTGAAGAGVDSIAERVPAAYWHEREARDRFGVAFTGLPDATPALPPPSADRLRRGQGEELSVVLYGPVRSGIVESMRWIIETAGEDFVHVHPAIYAKRRGVEERFAGVPLEVAPLVAEHVSGATAASHATAFSRAVEDALDLEVPPRARALRSALVELERVHQHLDALAKLAEDGSLAIGAAQLLAAKERVHRLLAEATGSRFARGVICVGGLRDDLAPPLLEAAERGLDEVERHAVAAVEGFFGTQSSMDRLIGTGRLAPDIVRELGGVGPVARGSGVSCDARLRDGWLYTPLQGDEALADGGDAYARARVRAVEMRRSFRLIRNALDSIPDGPVRSSVPVREGSAIARVESPQGELLYYVRLEGGAPARVAIRSASFANWPLFVPSLPGNIFTDFSFIEHSFGLIHAETDR